MIDAHIHVVPPNLPGCGPLGEVLRYAPEFVAQAVRDEMAAAGATRAFAMGEWRITPDDPLGVNRTLKLAELVPGLAAVGVADPTRDKDDREHFRRVESVLAAGRVVALKAYLGYL